MTTLCIDPATVPPRIVLSRKGSDAAWGGRPSLRVGDELISLPIPEGVRRSRLGAGMGLRYGDLPAHSRVGAFHGHLKNTSAEDLVHLDPDLRPALRGNRHTHMETPPGLFGQVGAAARHLDHQGVGPGTLFLFFGWFREVVELEGKWRRAGRDEHTVWGWLEVGAVHPVNTAEHAAAMPWAQHHPHAAHWQRYDVLNRIYRSTERLSFAPALPGAGVFRYKPALSLTRPCDPAATRRQWCLPSFFRSAGLTYNQKAAARNVSEGPCRRSRMHLDSAPIGQEFVTPAGRRFRAQERAAVARWLEDLFEGV